MDSVQVEMKDSDVRPVSERLREMVVDVDPDTVEVVRLGNRAATYGVGPKKMSEGYACILPYKNWVNLGFYKGTDLMDPEGLLEGTGKKMRHLKVRSVEGAGQPALRALIEKAFAERKRATDRQ